VYFQNLAMAVDWPPWDKFQDIVKKDKVMGANADFQEFKKQVLKASVEEIDAQAQHAPVMWDFLLAFAAKKSFFRKLIIQVFNKLMQAPGWAAAWEKDLELHAKVKELHEELQSALGAQHEVLLKSIAPAALKSVALVRKEDKPEEVRVAMERERMIDAIKEEDEKTPAGADAAKAAFVTDDTAAEEEVVRTTRAELAALQEGIDAASGIDDASKMDSGGINALNKLRIGCIQCAGEEDLFQQELDHAPTVFIFLMTLAKQHPASINGVAEVMNQLMASPSWSALFEASTMLKDKLRELPDDLQAALGLQSEKVMRLIGATAKTKATGGDVPASVKGVADRMQSIRMPPRPMGGGYGAAGTSKTVLETPPVLDQWKAAKTPEGHSYYFNVRTRESTWERPAALGGPLVYKVGDEVEVWSNSMRAWCKGRVDKVEGDKVTASLTLPDGSLAKKELPSQYKDLRPMAAEKSSALTEEERTAYQALFRAIEGGSESSKPAVQISHLLWKSKLARETLKQVWMTANPGQKANLNFDEFARCCRLIAHCQAMADSPLVKAGDRPLRVKLRTECLYARPPALPKFS